MGGIGEAIAAAVAWVVSVIGTQTVTAFVIRLAITTAITAALRALQPKPKSMDQGAVLQTKVDPAYPREVAVGKFATGGSLAYENVSGATNEYLWRVIVLSDCEIEEVTQIRGNGEALTFSGDVHTGLRACTSHFQDPNGADMLSVRIYKGTSTQTADADLDAAFTEITSNFRLRGVAYALVKMQWNSEAWQSGSELVFVGKGAKCYDPRTATTVWTENAALIARQYLKGFTNNGITVVGVGCSDSDLPDADWISAADECDEAVSLAAGGTEARYRAGGMINSRDEPRSVLADLAAAMGGAHIDTGGQVIMLPGVTRAAVMDISEDDLRADAGIVYAARRTADERVNCIASTFVNPDDSWQEAPLPPRKNATRITNDGARYESGRAYRFVYSKTQGQRLDEIELRKAGYEGMLSFVAPLWGFELTPGDLFTMTSERWGGVQKLWEVQTVDLAIINGKSTKSEPEARCSITARETGADVYSWTTGDELTIAAGAVTQPAALGALPEYNDNAAAVAGGLTTGDLYFAKNNAYKLTAVVSLGGGQSSGVSEDTTTDNASSGTTHVEVGRIAFSSVAVGGKFRFMVQGATEAGETSISDGGPFFGAYELLETATGAGSGSTLATGTWTCTDTGGGLFDFDFGFPDGLGAALYAVNTSGARDVVLKIWRSSGTNQVSQFTVTLTVEYVAPAS